MVDNQDSALAVVFERNAFYKQQYIYALIAFVLSLLALMILLGVLLFLKRNPTQPVYFATDPVGRLIQVVPVSEPNMAIEKVIAWAEEAAIAAYSYDFVNFRSQLQDAQKYFIDVGWRNYIAALKASNNLVALKDRKMIVSASIVGEPKILNQGILAGAYAWKFEMPMLVTYWLPPYDDKSKFTNALTVTMIVQRQPILQSYKGLGLVQIIGAVAQGGPNQPQEISNMPTG